MVPVNSLGEVFLTATALRDVCKSHEAMFSTRECEADVKTLFTRCANEGMSFLTKTLPALGKALDKALSGEQPFSCSDLGFKTKAGSAIPLFMGGFLERVLHSDGTLREDGCIVSVGVLRQILYLWYKYELPYSSQDKLKVIDAFVKTEADLVQSDHELAKCQVWLDYLCEHPLKYRESKLDDGMMGIVLRAREILFRCLHGIDLVNIRPHHGPGTVSTREQFLEKYQWMNIDRRITDLYPLDTYFYASAGHVCDAYPTFPKLGDASLPARVCLVPKDSRGPRLISCEPVDHQWIQQGIRSALYERVENHYTTKWNVFFTNQAPNQRAALLGSRLGEYATLDLKEASDRVSLALVRLLFPSAVLPALECCRSLATELPDGTLLPLRKFAPMGSALCFPIMALTIYAIIHAVIRDPSAREGILVYGDDVVVPTEHSADTISALEAFGLKVNRDKSCTKGLFRESCGVDAFRGYDVTPLKLKTVWSDKPLPDAFASWVAYANAFIGERPTSIEKRRQYHGCYDHIVAALSRLYWPIADDSMPDSPVRLRHPVPAPTRPVPRRINKDLQKVQYKSLEVAPRKVKRNSQGWEMLLRFFAESRQSSGLNDCNEYLGVVAEPHAPIAVDEYTKRNASILAARWR